MVLLIISRKSPGVATLGARSAAGDLTGQGHLGR